jgi:hypothetical protein
MLFPFRLDTSRDILNLSLLIGTNLAGDDGNGNVGIPVVHKASNGVSSDRTDNVKKLCVALDTVDSGQPVVAARNLPGDVLLGTIGVHVDDFPLSTRVHHDRVFDDGEDDGLRVDLEGRKRRDNGGLGWELLRHRDGRCLWCLVLVLMVRMLFFNSIQSRRGRQKRRT